METLPVTTAGVTSSIDNTKLNLLDTCFSAENLHDAFMEIRGNIHFKYNVQNYRINELLEISKFRTAYGDGTFAFSKSRPFRMRERGHERLIHPIVFRDRVVVHAFCKHVLIPKLTPYLIYDNCASLKGKGVDKAQDRFRVHLKRYFFRHKTNEGYILQIDCRKYFDNLRHDEIIRTIGEKLTEEELGFLKMILKENEIDASHMTENEREACMNSVFNSLEYAAHHYPQTGEIMLEKSIGIGSEASQIIGLYYLHRIDNYIKIVKGFKEYARYADDSYVISDSKQALKDLLEELKIKYKEIGLEVSEKKTQIRKLNRPVTYLKVIYILTDTGKVIMRKHKDTFRWERVKLKKLARKLKDGKITYKSVKNQYKGWRGTIMRRRKGTKVLVYKNLRQVRAMDKLYNELFIDPFIRGELNDMAGNS